MSKIDISEIIGPVLGVMEPAAVQRDYGGGGCWNHSPTVDPVNRKVHCGKCRAELDPIDVLATIAHANSNGQYLRAEVEKLRKELEALKAEEQRVKARTRNAARKDADFAVAAERQRTLEARRRCIDKAREAQALLAQLRQALGSEFDE